MSTITQNLFDRTQQMASTKHIYFVSFVTSQTDSQSLVIAHDLQAEVLTTHTSLYFRLLSSEEPKC
jgi:hypothetical protein